MFIVSCTPNDETEKREKGIKKTIEPKETHINAKEIYEKVNPKELRFQYIGKAKGIALLRDGNYKVTGGIVTKFSLEGIDIPLQTPNLTEDAFIVTKDFGNVKVTFDSLLRATIWLTPKQKRAFKQFAKKVRKD